MKRRIGIQFESDYKYVEINDICVVKAPFRNLKKNMIMKLLFHQKCHLVLVIMKQHN